MSFNIDNYISNLTYINKDFNSTWEEILEVVPKLTNKWVPSEANESDPLVVLLKELGIVTDKLNYNIDKNTLESFPDLLTQLRAAYSIFTSMGYVPQWYRSALTSISVVYNGGAGSTTSAGIEDRQKKDFNLPIFTEISDSKTNIIYTLVENKKFTVGTVQQQYIQALEGTINDFEINGNTCIDATYLDSQNRLYFVQPNVAQNGIFISDNSTFSEVSFEDSNYQPEDLEFSQRWRRVTTLYQQLPGSKVFQFGIDPSTGSAYIQFPDDIGNLIQNGIYIKYILSSGSSGNIAANTLTRFVVNPSIEVKESSTSTEVLATVIEANFTLNNGRVVLNGKDPETIEEMQKNYSRIVGTFNTLVTLKDYENFLYNQENSLGVPVVSNIKVSDRTCDLYSTYKVRSLNSNYEIVTKTKQVENNELTAYELRLYPLRPVSDIVDKDSFDKTFEYIKDDSDSTSSIPSDKTFSSQLEAEVASAKAIIHDFKKPSGAPIFLDYSLEGEIYLQKSVSKEEAEEIRNKVKLNIYQHLNARELTFGKEIDFASVMDIIKDSDPRIQFVSLRPIEYRVDQETSDLFNKRAGVGSTTDDKILTKRSVLAGATPWTQYEDLSTYWGSTDITSYDQIKTIASKVDLSEETTSSYIVGPNETLSIIVPGYATETTYTNFTYMYWFEGENALKNASFILAKDTPYKLKGNEFIRIYSRRPTDISKTDYVLAELTAGTIISSNVALGKDTNYSLSDASKPVNMTAEVAVSVLKRDVSKLENTQDASKGIKIATNSQGLCDVLNSNTKTRYTLNIGEYLLWAYNTDPVLEVGTIGEGNTIIINGQSPFSEGANEIKVLDSSAKEVSYKTCSNDLLSYQANTVYSFGENYVLRLISDTNTKPWKDFKDAQGVFDLEKVTSIEYAEGIKDKYDESLNSKEALAEYVNSLLNSDSTRVSQLPGILEGDKYQASLNLALIIGPEKCQKLAKNQNLVLVLGDKSTQAITNKYLQTSISVVYPGGQALTLSDKEAAVLTLRTFSGNKDTTKFERDSFLQVTGDQLNIPVVSGMDDNQQPYFVFAARDIYGSVNYVLARGNQTINITRDSTGTTEGKLVCEAVGPLYQIKKDATTAIGQEISTLLGSSSWKLLTSSDLYDQDGCPIYIPTKSELIENPTEAASFWKGSHICNKYVLPRLYVKEGDPLEDPLEKLVISSMSIKD